MPILNLDVFWVLFEGQTLLWDAANKAGLSMWSKKMCYNCVDVELVLESLFQILSELPVLGGDVSTCRSLSSVSSHGAKCIPTSSRELTSDAGAYHALLSCS